jgi:hypothetical protein
MRLVIDEALVHVQTPGSVMLVDEVHRSLQNTLRTNACRRVAAAAEHSVAFTGTPVIDHKMTGLKTWLSNAVEYPVTNANLWVAALTGDTVITDDEDGPSLIPLQEDIIEAPFTPEETKAYLACMPPSLGGMKPKPTREDFAAGVRLCEEACIRWMIDNVPCKSLVFTKDARQQSYFAHAWAIKNEKDQKTQVFCVSKNAMIDLTPETIKSNEALAKLELVVAPRVFNAGYNVNAWAQCFMIPIANSVVQSRQMIGRLQRFGNPNPFVRRTCVVDPFGIFRHRLDKEGLAEDVAAALRAALRNV